MLTRKKKSRIFFPQPADGVEVVVGDVIGLFKDEERSPDDVKVKGQGVIDIVENDTDEKPSIADLDLPNTTVSFCLFIFAIYVVQ